MENSQKEKSRRTELLEHWPLANSEGEEAQAVQRNDPKREECNWHSLIHVRKRRTDKQTSIGAVGLALK